MKARSTTIALGIVAALSLGLAASAQAGPAGDEYLPKVPQAGSAGSGGSGGSDGISSSATPTTTLPIGQSDDAQGKPTEKKAAKRSKKRAPNQSKKQEAVIPISGSGGSGGDSSGSILFNPIVLLVIAAVIAAAVGMTLWRRRAEEAEGDREGTPDQISGSSERGGPRTPDGEIVAGPDQAS
jgi:hypothetical protein